MPHTWPLPLTGTPPGPPPQAWWTCSASSAAPTAATPSSSSIRARAPSRSSRNSRARVRAAQPPPSIAAHHPAPPPPPPRSHSRSDRLRSAPLSAAPQTRAPLSLTRSAPIPPSPLTPFPICDTDMGIILPDADLELAAKQCVAGSLSYAAAATGSLLSCQQLPALSSFAWLDSPPLPSSSPRLLLAHSSPPLVCRRRYNGQRCTAVKLIMVHETVADAFMEKFLCAAAAQQPTPAAQLRARTSSSGACPRPSLADPSRWRLSPGRALLLPRSSGPRWRRSRRGCRGRTPSPSRRCPSPTSQSTSPRCAFTASLRLASACPRLASPRLSSSPPLRFYPPTPLHATPRQCLTPLPTPSPPNATGARRRHRQGRHDRQRRRGRRRAARRPLHAGCAEMRPHTNEPPPPPLLPSIHFSFLCSSLTPSVPAHPSVPTSQPPSRPPSPATPTPCAAVVDGVTPAMRLFTEEQFGPVVPVARFSDVSGAPQSPEGWLHPPPPVAHGRAMVKFVLRSCRHVLTPPLPPPMPSPPAQR